MTTEQMSRCRILASKAQLSTVINTLYNLRLYHVTPHIKKDAIELDIGAPLADAESMSELVMQMRRIVAPFPAVMPVKGVVLTKPLWEAIKEKVPTLHEYYATIENEKQKLATALTETAARLKLLRILHAFPVDFASLKKSAALCFFLGTVQRLDELRQRLSKDAAVSVHNNIVLIIEKSAEKMAMAELLAEFNFSPLNIESIEDCAIELKKTDAEYTALKGREAELSYRFEKIRKTVPKLKRYITLLEEEIRKQELPLSFAVTKKSFVAEGWIPTSKKEEVRDAVIRATEKNVHITMTDPEKGEEPPVKLKNKRLVTPFEFLLRLYDLPMYREMDPTSLMFITFPLFFGFMLGDVGYGLVLAGIFWYIKKKIPAARELASVLLFAAVVTIAFGFIFGEYFGFEHVSRETGEALCNVGICLPQHTIEAHGSNYLVADFPRVLNRAHGQMNVAGFEILSVLVIGAVVGLIHLNLGLLLGFMNELQRHGFRHALEAKLSWIIMEAGIVLVLIPSVYWGIGTAVTIAGLILLAKGEGIQGLVEIPALASNTLSYMRLGAVGLASVGLAVVVNEQLAMPFIEKGGIFILIGIIIMLLGHAINILLGIIGPFLHGIRLHYVEFFSKFFRGGGSQYTPFGEQQEET